MKTYQKIMENNWQFTYGEDGQVEEVDYNRELPEDDRDFGEITSKQLAECTKQEEELRRNLIKIA